MDWLRQLTHVALLGWAIVVGGTLVRLVLAAGDPRVAVSLALVALFVAVAVLRGARSRRWRRNPYW